MKIKWYGHSAFGITSANGVHIVTDPYTVGAYDGALGYKAITDRADVILQSHDHPDHAGGRVPGNAVVLRDAGVHKVRGVEFRALATDHDASGGRERGSNTVFVFAVDGVTVAFMGDIGHVLTAEQAATIGPVDVLFVPVGGHFTVDAAGATAIAEQLHAKVTFPMHFKTPACGFPIAAVEPFLKNKPRVDRPGGAEVELTPETLAGPRVIVLDYAG